jgi:protein-tyrosine phosphatase
MSRTSQSHPIEVSFISPSTYSWPGQLGLTFAPRKKADSLYGEPWDRDLSTDLKQLREKFGVDLVCPLLEEAEFTALGIPTLREEAIALGMQVHHLPIPDTRAPDDQVAFDTCVSAAIEALKAGQTVVFHCKGGLGRAGTLTAAVLMAGGTAPEAAVTAVRATRPGAVETHEQEDFLRKLSEDCG